jgi:hypothetical protein
MYCRVQYVYVRYCNAQSSSVAEPELQPTALIAALVLTPVRRVGAGCRRRNKTSAHSRQLHKSYAAPQHSNEVFDHEGTYFKLMTGDDTLILTENLLSIMNYSTLQANSWLGMVSHILSESLSGSLQVVG